jgi:c-di-AMP phosphodiesterase-like protein
VAKTHKNINAEEKERESESAAHKRRREEKQRFKNLLSNPSLEELEDDEFETYEPIRRKSSQKR